MWFTGGPPTYEITECGFLSLSCLAIVIISPSDQNTIIILGTQQHLVQDVLFGSLLNFITRIPDGK